MSDGQNEHRGVLPRSKHGRKRPTGGLQGRLRALAAAGSARTAEWGDPRPECYHALRDGEEVHCTCAELLSERGAAAMRCVGSRCGHAQLPPPAEEVSDGA